MKQNIEPRNRPNKYSELIDDRRAKAIKWSKIAFSTNGGRRREHPHVTQRACTLVQ